MYLHLGNNVVVPTAGIVAVFDLDNSSQSHRTREFLTKAEKNKIVVDVSGELPKSFVLYEVKGKTTVYLSQLASSTLLKRSRNIDMLENT